MTAKKADERAKRMIQNSRNSMRRRIQYNGFGAVNGCILETYTYDEHAKERKKSNEQAAPLHIKMKSGL